MSVRMLRKRRRSNIKTICDKGIERLRYEIVKQAVVDYERSLKKIRKHTPPRTAGDEKILIQYTRLKNDCELFFRSGWFSHLCDIDGEMLIREIRKKSYNRTFRWGKDG